jgi:hypothetical protein
MKYDQFLSLRTLPVIIDTEKTAWLLGIHQDAVAILVKANHLEPLENPPPGSQRYFSSRYVLKLGEDEKWMRKAVRLIREHYRARNCKE